MNWLERKKQKDKERRLQQGIILPHEQHTLTPHEQHIANHSNKAVTQQQHTTITTNENAGHTHTISNAKSGYTDVTNGHRHKLASGCKTCSKIARMGSKLAHGKWITAYASGHIHTYQFNKTDKDIK